MKTLPHGVAWLMGAGWCCLASVAWGAPSSQSCPSGTRPGVDGCVDGSARARLRSERQEPPNDRGYSRIRTPDSSLRLESPDPGRLDRARRRLLILEIQRLENMLSSMPKKAPDRPTIMRRLAEGYAELAAQAERDRVRAQIRAELEARTPAKVAPVPLLPRPASKTMF